jgi:hypothetical protein
MECLICGKEIRPNQVYRALPKDKNCQEERVYHLRTCGPGSLRWKAFKENGKKPLRESISGGKMSFEWKNDTTKWSIYSNCLDICLRWGFNAED